MSQALNFWEHCKNLSLSEDQSEGLFDGRYEVKFKKTHRGNDASKFCFTITNSDDENPDYQLNTGYFIGLDWIVEGKKHLFVAPKLNKEDLEIDYIQMLFSSLQENESHTELKELFEVKWDAPKIEVTQQQDLLTPFLIAEFLGVLKTIVRKGLKKSYIKVERNLQSKVKGKVLVSKTIKQNLLQNKQLHTYCTYEEFSEDILENRLLKKAITFVQRYLPTISGIGKNSTIQNTFNYINPSFQHVSDKIELSEIKHTKTNSMFKEYERGMELAKMILRRFSYNISNTSTQKVSLPPFWIDMTKLFELHVLSLLRSKFGVNVLFQKQVGQANELDFILNDEQYKLVIDAKYKPKWKTNTDHDDVRQISAYCRLTKVYDILQQDKTHLIEGLIIYPDQVDGITDISTFDILKFEIKEYEGLYKLGIKLPVININ